MKRRIITLLKYLLTLFVLYFIFLKIDVSKTIELINNSRGSSLLMAGMLSVVFYVIKILKWASLLKITNEKNDLKTVSVSFLSGFIWGIATPGRFGEFARIVSLKGDKKILLSLAFIDRCFDLGCVILLATISSILAFPGSLFKILFIVFCAILIAVLCVILIRAINTSNAILNEFFQKTNKGVEILFFVHQKRLLWVFFLTIVAYLLLYIQFYFILNSFGFYIVNVVFLVPIAHISNLLQITVGGYGVREALFFILSNGFDVTKEIIINSSLLWCTMNIVVAVMGFLLSKLFLAAWLKMSPVVSSEGDTTG